jgi:hypothetical protein
MNPPSLRTRSMIMAWEVVGLPLAVLVWTGLSVWLGRVSLGMTGSGWLFLLIGGAQLRVGLEGVALSRRIEVS